MSLNHNRLERIREEYCTAIVESMSSKDKDSMIYNQLYLMVAVANERELQAAVSKRFGEAFWDDLKESVITEEMVFGH